jgi:hypothetical protein
VTIGPSIDIDAALRDPNLLGAALGDPASWSTWSACLRAAFGLTLNRQDRRAFDKVAGGRAPPSEKVAELWAICGRRSGKSRIAAAVAVFIALFIDHRGKLVPGEIGFVLALSASRAQAHVIFQYCLAFIESSDILRQQIESTTAEEIRLKNNIVIGVHPNAYRTVRGRTLLALVLDEVSYWRDETSASPDVEVYRAVLPALATTGGMLIGISSPYRRMGLLHSKHRDCFGQDNPRVLCIAGGTQLFNPTIDARIIDHARASDPESAGAEWDGVFRSDIASLLDDAVIDAAVDHSRPLELPPRAGLKYFGFTDASAGRHDAFTLCIGHREGGKEDGTFVADVIRGRLPPFDPKDVALEYAKLAKEYWVLKLIGDNYAGEWVAAAFKDAGVGYERSPLAKSALYLEGLAPFNRGLVSIPNIPRLVRELRLLERRVHRSGKDSVDHGVGGSDDYANVLFGAAYVAIGRREGSQAAFGTYGLGFDIAWNGAGYVDSQGRSIPSSDPRHPNAPASKPEGRLVSWSGALLE